MTQIDKAAIAWSITIVALGVGFAGFESQSQGTISNTDYIDTISEVEFDFTVVHVNIQYMKEGIPLNIHKFQLNEKLNPTIIVKKGDLVKLRLTNTDTMMKHDLVIQDLDLKTSLLEPGETTEIIFSANQEGEYDYLCTVHPDQMIGKIVIN
jgi:heme/copper-type cytochrome/quinol oxidase subunit 2